MPVMAKDVQSPWLLKAKPLGPRRICQPPFLHPLALIVPWKIQVPRILTSVHASTWKPMRLMVYPKRSTPLGPAWLPKKASSGPRLGVVERPVGGFAERHRTGWAAAESPGVGR